METGHPGESEIKVAVSTAGALTNCDNRYGTGTLTSVFLDRVFQECLTYDGEMDYKTYLDFVLALENRKEPQSLQYMFRLLDVQNKGCLNIFDLNYFFRVHFVRSLTVVDGQSCFLLNICGICDRLLSHFLQVFLFSYNRL